MLAMVSRFFLLAAVLVLCAESAVDPGPRMLVMVSTGTLRGDSFSTTNPIGGYSTTLVSAQRLSAFQYTPDFEYKSAASIVVMTPNASLVSSMGATHYAVALSYTRDCLLSGTCAEYGRHYGSHVNLLSREDGALNLAASIDTQLLPVFLSDPGNSGAHYILSADGLRACYVVFGYTPTSTIWCCTIPAVVSDVVVAANADGRSRYPYIVDENINEHCYTLLTNAQPSEADFVDDLLARSSNARIDVVDGYHVLVFVIGGPTLKYAMIRVDQDVFPILYRSPVGGISFDVLGALTDAPIESPTYESSLDRIVYVVDGVRLSSYNYRTQDVSVLHTFSDAYVNVVYFRQRYVDPSGQWLYQGTEMISSHITDEYHILQIDISHTDGAETMIYHNNYLSPFVVLPITATAAPDTTPYSWLGALLFILTVVMAEG